MDALRRMTDTLVDADADLVTVIGGHREVSRVRVWRGQVLVEWEADERAGGCLLRPALVERLQALHADVEESPKGLGVRASGRVVAALSQQHRELVEGLGGERVVDLRLRLRFAHEVYQGGEEAYGVTQGGKRIVVMRLTAEVHARVAQPELPRTSPAPR